MLKTLVQGLQGFLSNGDLCTIKEAIGYAGATKTRHGSLACGSWSGKTNYRHAPRTSFYPARRGRFLDRGRYSVDVVGGGRKAANWGDEKAVNRGLCSPKSCGPTVDE